MVNGNINNAPNTGTMHTCNHFCYIDKLHLPKTTCSNYELHSLHYKLSWEGVCHEILDLDFFHDSNPVGPLINRVKYFKIRFRFWRDIRSQNLKKIDSLVCMAPRSQNFRLIKNTFYNSNLLFHDRSVHPLKLFLLVVPLKATRDQRKH